MQTAAVQLLHTIPTSMVVAFQVSALALLQVVIRVRPTLSKDAGA